MISLQELSSPEWNAQREKLEDAVRSAVSQLVQHSGGAGEINLPGEHYHIKIVCLKPERTQ